MTNTKDEPTTLPPAPVIAQHLAAVVDLLPGNFDAGRERLGIGSELLRKAPPHTVEAHSVAVQGVAAAQRRAYAEAQRRAYAEAQPETWMLCAVAALQGGVPPAGPWVRVPFADDLAAWDALLLNLEKRPARLRRGVSTDPAVTALNLAMLRLWIVSLSAVRMHADASLPLRTDPDGLPYIGNAAGP